MLNKINKEISKHLMSLIDEEQIKLMNVISGKRRFVAFRFATRRFIM